MAASLGGILKRVERGEAVVLTAEEAFSLAESEGPDAFGASTS